MYCGDCGAEAGPAHRFCGSCGRPLGRDSTAAPAGVGPSQVQAHLLALSVLWIALGVWWILGGLWTFFAGSLFFWVVDFWPTGFPFGPRFLAPLFSLFGVYSLFSGAGGIVAGWGLMQRKHWARVLAIVLGFLKLLNIPFGTALGIYTLVILLPARAAAEWERIAPGP
jgi:hypothetical protein